MSPEPSFEFQIEPGTTVGSRLLVGTSAPAMSGLTAVDYVVDQFGADPIGHVTARGYPSLAPFAEGTPRPHTRLYDVPGTDLTVLVGELFVPVGVAGAYADGLVEWADDAGIEDVTMLLGIPYPHAPEEHGVYHVATDEYRERHLVDAGIEGLAGGFLDGLAGEIANRSVGGTAPPAGVLVTPSHPPGPDLSAALLFVEALNEVHDLSIDTGELEELSSELKRHYEELAERLEAMNEAAGSAESRDYAEDRAFM